MKALLRHVLSLIAVAGFALALCPAAQTLYAHWSQSQLQQQWQAAARASTSAPILHNEGSSSAPLLTKERRGEVSGAAKRDLSTVSFASSPSPSGRPLAGRRRGIAVGRGKGTRPWPPTRILASQIDLDAAVVQGTQPGDLRRGPGHDPATVLPGQIGNCIIAGHRNIYGSYLFKIDQLQDGSLITLKTPRDSYNYYVTSVYTVPDTNLTPYEATDPGVRQLTILSCTLPHSDERLVINAQM